MKKLNILKTILDLLWFSSIIAVAALTLFLPFLLFADDSDFTVKIRGQEISSQSIFSRIIICVNVISGLLFLNSIYLLRKVVYLFQKREIFNIEIIRMFNLIGKLIVASSMLSGLSLLVYNRQQGIHHGITLDFGSYDSFLVSVSLGIFFMVMSEVFRIAKTMKEENDLMI